MQDLKLMKTVSQILPSLFICNKNPLNFGEKTEIINFKNATEILSMYHSLRTLSNAIELSRFSFVLDP